MKKNVQGAGLIEVLIALFVTAIGLLGFLAMQVSGLAGNQRAEYSTEAHLLASDMMNMITAYNSFDNHASERFSNVQTAADLNVVDCSSGCSRANQYAHDLYQWSERLSSGLPSGQGTVTFDADTEMFTITVMWDAERTGATGTSCSGNGAVDLRCYVLEVQI